MCLLFAPIEVVGCADPSDRRLSMSRLRPGDEGIEATPAQSPQEGTGAVRGHVRVIDTLYGSTQEHQHHSTPYHDLPHHLYGV